MRDYFIRFLIYFICFIFSIFALGAFEYNRFLKKKVNPLQAQMLYLIIAACIAYLLANFISGIIYYPVEYIMHVF